MIGRRPPLNTQGRGVSMPPSPARLDAELEEEFRFHLEERIEELMAGGMSREEAAAEVTRRFGNFETYRQLTHQIDQETMRQERRADFWGTLLRESRHSARLLWRQRSFSLIAFITLTLGMAAATAMFAVLDSVVLRPLPYANPNALVSVLHPASVPGSGERRWGLSPGGYFHFLSRSRTLSSLGIYRNDGFTVTTGGDAELVRVAAITQSMFTTLGARAESGRLIGAGDDAPGAPPVVVLSHEFHQRRFGGDRSIVGKTLETSGGTFEVIGVVTPGLTLPMPGPFASTANLAGFGVDVWTPLQLNPAGPFYNNHAYVGVGRLKGGVTADAAQQEFTTLLGEFVEHIPNAYSQKFLEQYNFRVEVRPLRDAVLGDSIPRALWMLFGSVVFVLVIAAANVGNLFLVRMEARRGESAVRAALGADRTHMAAHYLSESLLLCLAAAVAAVGLANVAVRALLLLAPRDIPRLAAATLGWPAVGVALGIGLALGVVLGIVPLLGPQPGVSALREGGRGPSGSLRQRIVRSSLVVGQIALTLVLLAAGGMMLRSFSALRNVPAGFDPANVMAFDFSLPFSTYDTREEASTFHRALQERLTALPGLVAVGAGALPLEAFGTGCTVVFREGRPYGAGEQTPCVSTPTVLPGFFQALGIPVQGRIPDWTDANSRSQAAVVTRALANRLWPGEDPVGKGIGSNGPDSKAWYRVVGVVSEIRAEALDQPPTEAVFYPPTSLREGGRSGELNDLTYVLRTKGVDPMSLVASVRAVLREMNPQVPFIDPRAMTQVLARSLSGISLSLVLLGVAGTMGLLLSAVGLYGVVSYMVIERRGEIGVRMALGAGVTDVLRLVLMNSIRLTLLGVLVGAVGAVALGQVLQQVLFAGHGLSALLLLGIAALLLAVVTIASWSPARRAARIDPVESIRGG